MWIVQVALRCPYTFIVLAILIRIAGRREELKQFMELHESLLAKLRQSNVSAATKDLRTIFARIARLFRAPTEGSSGGEHRRV